MKARSVSGVRRAAPALGAILAAALGCSCFTRMYDTRPGRPSSVGSQRVIRPVVAVSDFENQAGFSGQWQLGGGMADLLSTQLLQTERVIVLERRNLPDLLTEIARQGQNLFRPEGRVSQGRLKNARYLLRGVITDFTVSRDTTGWFGVSRLRTWCGSSAARVSMNVKIADVETGEIVGSVRAESTATSGFLGGDVNYHKIGFGGDAFYRTPLGLATEAAMRKAVRQILETLPAEYWEPRVAEADGGDVIVNGGENVNLRRDTQFVVRGEGRTVTDPLTGDAIEHMPGKVIGRIRVTEVRTASSHAALMEGAAPRGSVLEPAPPAGR